MKYYSCSVAYLQYILAQALLESCQSFLSPVVSSPQLQVVSRLWILLSTVQYVSIDEQWAITMPLCADYIIARMVYHHARWKMTPCLSAQGEPLLWHAPFVYIYQKQNVCNCCINYKSCQQPFYTIIDSHLCSYEYLFSGYSRFLDCTPNLMFIPSKYASNKLYKTCRDVTVPTLHQ